MSTYATIPAPESVRAMLLHGFTRVQTARALHCRVSTIYQVVPTTDMDRLRLGKAVNLGGILVKRCRRCLVTKELDKFYMATNASGCSATCLSCGAPE